jgi:uncharacterized membrane protein YfcA
MVTKATSQVGIGDSIGIVVGAAEPADQGVLVDIWVVIAGLIVGFVVGLTGMGGGALMTPLLVLVFGVTPLTAVSSDLVAALAMKPVGGGLHLRRGTVHRGLVLWLALGSVPSAFAGAILLDRFAGPQLAERMKVLLGAVLLVAAAAMVLRGALLRRRAVPVADPTIPIDRRVPVRRVPTVVVGVIGGLIVGLTSVGSGSLMIVALMLLYPNLTTAELVGTDLVQAIPLVGAAALGHLLFGSVEFGLTAALLVGGIPGVWFGAHLSSRANTAIVRPALVAVLLLSGAKLLGASNPVLLAGAIAGCLAVAASVARRPRVGVPVPGAVPLAEAVAAD